MMNQSVNKANELFYVVDEKDRPLAPMPRRLVHGHGVWHRVAHIWLVNDAGEILCQQRALNKELNPGLWEPFFGGHLRPRESYATGAARELGEELGIQAAPGDLHLWHVYKFSDPYGSRNNEFQAVFALRWNGVAHDLTFDDGEVERVIWKSGQEVAQAVSAPGQDWTVCGYEQEMIQFIAGWNG